METHFLIQVLEWAEKKPNGFTKEELIASRTFENWEKEILDGYFADADTNHKRTGLPSFTYLPETIFHVIRMNPKKAYVLTPDAFFKYIDYTELKLARQTAKEAKNSSEKSIKISSFSVRIAIFAIMISLLALFMTQTVKLEDEQFRRVESLISTSLEN
ncbi:hypothetical protein IT398_01870 [Candidatus Nomurabacteria bacterium]|nr:hypothetical protein [Candidatus Nomurabacteria bacterium]